VKRLLHPSLFRRYLFTATVLTVSLFLVLSGYFWFALPDAESVNDDLTLAAHGLVVFTDFDNDAQVKIFAEKVRAVHLKFVSPKPEQTEIQYVLFRDGRMVASSEAPPMEIIATHKAKPPARAVYERGWYLAAATNETTRTVAFFATKESFPRRILRDAMWSSSSLIAAFGYLAFLLLASSLAATYAMRPIVALANRIRSLKPEAFETLSPRTAYSELEPVVAAINARTDALKRQLDVERQFFSNAAHELRTPLAVIHAQAHGVARASNTEDRSERVSELQRGVDRAARSLARMLQLARLDAAAPPMEKTRLSVRDVAADCIAFHAPRAFANGQTLSLNEAENAYVFGNRDDLVTILDNLLENAINYAGAGTDVLVTLKVNAQHGIELSVCDNGPGFSADDHAIVFERFRRGNQSHNVEGSGLGLAIVRAAAARLGGSVKVSDREGGGLCVSLIFDEQTPSPRDDDRS
jgi:two-component system, OmpR family, sensor histidine kinase QseC